MRPPRRRREFRKFHSVRGLVGLQGEMTLGTCKTWRRSGHRMKQEHVARLRVSGSQERKSVLMRKHPKKKWLDFCCCDQLYMTVFCVTHIRYI